MAPQSRRERRHGGTSAVLADGARSGQRQSVGHLALTGRRCALPGEPWSVVLDRWDVPGDLEKTEHWRSVVPTLSTDAAEDQTGVENDRYRVGTVRQRYALELKHLTRTERSRGFVTSRLTRISDWSPLTDQERADPRADSPFALCRGVPSGLLPQGDRRVDEDLGLSGDCLCRSVSRAERSRDGTLPPLPFYFVRDATLPAGAALLQSAIGADRYPRSIYIARLRAHPIPPRRSSL